MAFWKHMDSEYCDTLRLKSWSYNFRQPRNPFALSIYVGSWCHHQFSSYLQLICPMTLYEEREIWEITWLCYIRLWHIKQTKTDSNASTAKGFLPQRNLNKSLLGRHSSRFCAESNSPTVLSDGSRDTRPLQEVGEPGLTLRNALPSKSDGRPSYRRDGSKIVYLNSEREKCDILLCSSNNNK